MNIYPQVALKRLGSDLGGRVDVRATAVLFEVRRERAPLPSGEEGL
jgi:hypothetical protein